MAENKTKPNNSSVKDFINTIENEKKRNDAYELLELFKNTTGEPPKMWGDSIIGFGTYHYKYDSGREGDFMLAGFSPRKTRFSIYIMSGFTMHNDLLEKLGKFKTSKACLYVNKLADIQQPVLSELISESIKIVKKRYQ